MSWKNIIAYVFNNNVHPKIIEVDVEKKIQKLEAPSTFVLFQVYPRMNEVLEQCILE